MPLDSFANTIEAFIVAFQFSIGDATSRPTSTPSSISKSLSILYWRCVPLSDVEYPALRYGFQFSIGDAGSDPRSPLEERTGSIFQFSIGDA